MNMMWFVLFLYLLPLLRVHATVNLTYILKKEKDKVSPSCIAEELERYAGLGWIYPMPSTEDELPEIATKFIPIINNDYNCKFSKDSLCSLRWANIDWTIDRTSTKTREFIRDDRWEDFPTVFTGNTTKEFKERFEIEGISSSAFSVRASGSVELFLCTGWNPYNYPCYYFQIRQREIFFNKFTTVPRNLNESIPSHLANYRAFSNIVSEDEWRNFIVNTHQNGMVQLIDVNMNRTVVQHTDKDPLKPTYMLMRSLKPSLWKIHKNDFMYTEKTGKYRLGPQISIASKDLCVSLYVATCNHCEMVFFEQNKDNLETLKVVGATDNKWVQLKVKKQNVLNDKITLFVETKLSENTQNTTNGFWAIDNVRICHENEVKVSYLRLNESFTDDDVSEDVISCQLIEKPNWRPRKLTYNEITDFPDILATSNTTDITLSWKQEDPRNEINYFVSYQANDICTSGDFETGLKRIKSNGFLSTKFNEITIGDLVPYTRYNITVSTVLHENDKRLSVNTLPTDAPSDDEIPFKIQARPNVTWADVTWTKPSCASLNGPLVYSLVLSSTAANFTVKRSSQTENYYRFINLRPFTEYSLEIFVGRTDEDVKTSQNVKTVVIKFTTLAGEAPPVKNLEIYAAGSEYVSFRYDLPQVSFGVPEVIQIRRCLKAKCKNPLVQAVVPCTLWPQKYCADMTGLAPLQRYKFKISLRNGNSNAYGEEEAIDVWTVEREPASPENITYTIVDCLQTTDYCHLNVSWNHPYFPNGTITAFNIILNSTSKRIDAEEDKNIHEVYKVANRTYLRTYTYQIKYVPYSAEYKMYLQSANTMFKSDYTTAIIKTAEIGDHIDQSPKLLGKSDSAFIFTLPHLDRRLESYTLTVAVQDFNMSKPLSAKLKENVKVASNLCHDFGETWISQIVKVENNDTERITVGSNEKHRLRPDTEYCIIFIVTNSYKDSEHDVVYTEKLKTLNAPELPKTSSGSYSHLYVLLLLLFLVPVGFLIYRYFKKRRSKPKPQQTEENVYESLPFDECEPIGNTTISVNNDTYYNNYDRLLHK